MKFKNKIYFIAAGLFYLLAHFLFLSSYVFKPNKYSFFYCYPYFHQNWNLFIPPPENNYNLYVFYTDENKIKQKADIFRELLVVHQSNRINGTEPLLLALSNTIHYFENESKPGYASENNFKMIEVFAKNYLQHTRHVKIIDLKLILLVSGPDSIKTRIFYN